METTTQKKSKEEILFPLHGHCPEELEMVYRHDEVLKAMDEWAKIAGISWFSIAEGKLPPVDPESHFHISVEVLITDGEDIAKGTYSFTQKDFCFNGIWEPTHWAHLTLPVK